MQGRVKLDFDSVCKFIQEFQHLRELPTPNDRLVEDLGIEGDDGMELIIEFGNRYNVDMNELDPTRYFPPEGFSLLDLFRPQSFVTLRVRDLVERLAGGRWVGP